MVVKFLPIGDGAFVVGLLDPICFIPHCRKRVLPLDDVLIEWIIVSVVNDLPVDQTRIQDFFTQDFKADALTR